MTLDNLLVRGRNNLDFMRLVAAALVIVSHAYPLSRGAAFEHYEPLKRLTGGQLTLGTLSVSVFFIISRFLITASWERSSSPWTYLRSRALRIFPALVPLLLLTTFVLGPLVTTLPLGEYLTDGRTYRSLEAFLLYEVNNPLPGVFEGQAFAPLVNGSLWTLSFEFACYLIVMALGTARLLRRDVVLLLVAAALAWQLPIVRGAWVLLPDSLARDALLSPTLLNLARFGSFFLGGAAAYLYRDRLRLTWWGAALAVAALAGTAVLGRGFIQLLPFAGAYAVLYLGSLKGPLNRWGSLGDFSYGVYIYAWPIQQTLVHAWGGAMPVAVNALLAVPLAVAFGAASWHLVEKRALRLKRRPARHGMAMPYRSAT